MASERVLTLVCTVITVIDNDLDKIHVHYTMCSYINTAAITTKTFEIRTFISFYSTEITSLFVNKKMVHGKPTSDFTKGEVIALKQDGKSVREISKLPK